MRLQSASLFPHWCSRMGRVLSVCLLVVGVIHLLPLAGVVGASRLSALYGIAVAEPNLELLLRHRAVLFGVLGGLCIAAAFQPAGCRPPR